MNIYYNTPHTIDVSLIISIIALISSWVAICFQLYFQFFRKTKKLILNVLTNNLSNFSNSPDTQRDVAKNKISLTNSGNTSILLVHINYQTIDLSTLSTYETNLSPNNLPILLKSGETILYNVISNTDLFINAIKGSEGNNNSAVKFNVYLRFVVVANDKSANYQVLIHQTQYYNPQKVHHSYRGSMSGINVLDKKYISLI